MCEHSLIEARQRGFKAMQFNFVVSTNERAVRLWQSLGFGIVGRLPLAFDHPVHGASSTLSSCSGLFESEALQGVRRAAASRPAATCGAKHGPSRLPLCSKISRKALERSELSQKEHVMSEPTLSDKGLSIFVFAAYHQLASGKTVSEVVLARRHRSCGRSPRRTRGRGDRPWLAWTMIVPFSPMPVIRYLGQILDAVRATVGKVASGRAVA